MTLAHARKVCDMFLEHKTSFSCTGKALNKLTCADQLALEHYTIPDRAYDEVRVGENVWNIRYPSSHSVLRIQCFAQPSSRAILDRRTTEHRANNVAIAKDWANRALKLILSDSCRTDGRAPNLKRDATPTRYALVMASNGSPGRVLPFAAQGIAAPSGFPYAELLRKAGELDHDNYEEPPHIAPSNKRSAEEAFSEDDASSDSSEPSSIPSQSCAGPSLPKKGRKSQYHRKRAQRSYDQSGHVTTDRAFDKYLRNVASVPTDIHLPDLPATSCGYQAKNSDGSYKPVVPNLDELLAEGFTYEKWDGRQARLYGVHCYAVAQGFEGVLEGAYEAIAEAEKKMKFKEKELNHRRGNYGQVTTGVPASNLKHKRHDKIIAELLQNKDIQRIAGFASAAFKMCAPRLYEEYRIIFNKLFETMPGLNRNFARSVWTAAG
ncbi:hypothetical protein BKA70DRAFT_1232722, partial [Coprinopsis sp. MPI-PUGE-AT-0042]